jgi:hypothetical protein
MVPAPQESSSPASIVLDRLDAAQQTVSDEILLLERKRHPLLLQRGLDSDLAAIERAIEQHGQVLEILEQAERVLLRRYAVWAAVTPSTSPAPPSHSHQQDIQHEKPQGR